MIKITSCLFFLFLTAASALAQDSTSLVKKQKKKSLKPAADFDQRFSFLDHQPVNIWGYRIGVIIKDKYKVGIGGYFLEQNIKGEIKLRRNILYYQQNRKLYFGTIYYEPFLLRKKLYETSLVFEVGFGRVILDSLKKIRNTQTVVQEKQTFVPAGIGVSINLKVPEIKHLHFLTYIGLNGMIGLRKTVFETDLKYNYDGWYWSIGSAIFIDKIFTDIKINKKKKMAAQQQNKALPTEQNTTPATQ